RESAHRQRTDGAAEAPRDPLISRAPGLARPLLGGRVMRITRSIVPHLGLLSLLAAAPLAGCGGSSAGTGGGSSSSSSGAGTGGAGGMVSCPAGSHAGDAGACEATLSGWTETSSLLQ